MAPARPLLRAVLVVTSVAAIVAGVSGIAVAGTLRFSAGAVKQIPGKVGPEAISCPPGKAVRAQTCYVLGSIGPNGDVSAVVKGRPKAGSSLPQYGVGMACPSATTCVIATSSNGGTEGTVMWLTNGKVTRTQGVSNASYFYQVSCESPTTCVAVGVEYGKSDSGVFAVVTESASSASATKVAGTADLYGVTCTSAKSCLAVGTSGSGSKAKGVVVRISSGKAAATKDATGTSSLDYVSCGTASHCWATGQSYSAKSGITTAIIPITSSKPGAEEAGPEFVGGIACVSATSCLLATATAQYGHGRVDELVSGKVVNGITLQKFAYGTLTGVSCPTRKSCIVTGDMSFHNPGPSYYYLGGVSRIQP